MSFLPGHFPGAVAAVGGAEPLTSLSVFGSDFDRDASPMVPVGVQAGDIIVVAEYVASTDINPATPAGFTAWMTYGLAVSDGNGFQSWLRVSHKVAIGTEGGTSINAANGNHTELRGVVIIRPNTPATTITATPTAGTNPVTNGWNTNGNPEPITLAAGSKQAPLIVFGFYGAAGTVSPRTMTPAKDGEIGSNPSGGSEFDAFYIAWKIYNSTPANVTIDMEDEGNLNLLAGGILEIS